MYRQQRVQNLRDGRGLATEVEGRDRAMFFRRPVEPGSDVFDNTYNNLKSGASGEGMQVQFTASCPTVLMPASAASISRVGSAGNHGHQPSSPHRRPQRRFRSPDSIVGSLRIRRAGGGQRRAKPYHLPSLKRGNSADSVGIGEGTQANRRAVAAVQTMYRDNEAQTDPYSPDYYIPEGAPTPEILDLQCLTYKNGGLPSGKEGVELIQRLRRRRDVEASLPTGNDAASIEARYTMLHELEEKEWAEREEHVSRLQQKRLERMRESLQARENAREEANRNRLERIKSQCLQSLGARLTSLEKRRIAFNRRGVDKKAQLQALESGCAPGQTYVSGEIVGVPQSVASMKSVNASRGSKSKPSIAVYARYGTDGEPPQVEQGGGAGGSSIDSQLRAARKTFQYDIRPQLLTDSTGTEVVDKERGARMDRVAPKTFVAPENEAVQRLPTVYQRREAEKVLSSLDYAYNKLYPSEDAEAAKAAEMSPQRVLELYRATPKLQRPETPVLMLDGDEQEEQEDACILLQRLLRGRAVQNDFFDGRERCRGLIEELQAASKAQAAEQQAEPQRKAEALAKERKAQAQYIASSALGAIIHDTLGFLSQELGRHQDMAALRRLQAEAEVVRATREAAERARRAHVRKQRDRNEVAYAAYARATDTTLQCFLDDVTRSAIEETAMAAAVESERARQASRPSPEHPSTEEEAQNMVCDMLDGFVIPAIVDAIGLQARDFEKKAVAGAALDAGHRMGKTSSQPPQ